jgi:hypothetical protein
MARRILWKNRNVLMAAAMGGNPNLIVNGSFSADTASWAGNGAALASIAGGYVGNCLRVTNSAAAVGFACQQIMLPAGTYTLNVMHKNGTGNGFVSVSQSAAGYDLVNQTIADADWTLFTTAFTIAFANPWINLGVGSTSAGVTSLYDSIEVYK